MKERLQKIIAAHGLSSRRAAEDMLASGRVSVNGLAAKLGDSADPERDAITVDGRPLTNSPPKTYLMLNKPRGYVTTLSDERGRKTVAELVSGVGVRVLPVGRLDINSEGLLLMTNDGALIQKLTHPSHEVDKVYLAWVLGNAKEALPVLSEPMVIDGQALRRARVELVNENEGQALIRLRIHEGKNRQVRRMCAQAGLRVTRLKRIEEGRLRLSDLEPGKWRVLDAQEIGYLLSL